MQPVPLVTDALRPGPALAVRDACIGWLPFGGLLARLGDPVVRRWMRRTGLAVPRPQRPGRSGASADECRPIPQRDMAGLRRRADGRCARPLRRLDQPGADAPAHAAVAGPCPQRAGGPALDGVASRAPAAPGLRD